MMIVGLIVMFTLGSCVTGEGAADCFLERGLAFAAAAWLGRASPGMNFHIQPLAIRNQIRNQSEIIDNEPLCYNAATTIAPI